MTNPLQLFDISPTQIQHIVAVFYARIRIHPVLGPIFAAHVTDWAAHEVKIAAFWRNAILKERCYNGSPMRAHVQAGNVKPAHFALWLELFDDVVSSELPAETAQSFSALAHRIGRGLRLQLEALDRPDSIPSLL